MMNKKGGTITGVFISVIIIMAIFYGTFNYVSSNYESAGLEIPLNYTQSYIDLQNTEANLSSNVEDIKDSTQGISEADGSFLNVAWNGLTGVASTIRLFINLIDLSVQVWNAILPGLAFIPNWLKVLIEMALIITIILRIVGAFKGESKT